MVGPNVQTTFDLVFANGAWVDRRRIGELCRGAARIVACDGALQRCLNAEVMPSVVMGDMDSVDPEALETFTASGGEVVRLVEQNSNDLAKAVRWLEQNGSGRCIVVGATGGDPQHEWANLLSCAASNIDVECESTTQVYRFLRPGATYSIEFEQGEEFSLFALPEARGINVFGATYPLTNATLEMGSQGLHNVAEDERIELRFKQGRLMLMQARPDSTGEETSEA
mgnify:FL=1